MRKVDRQPDQKEPYAGGHDPTRFEPTAPNPSAKDKSKGQRRPDEHAGSQVGGSEANRRLEDPEILENDRSDRSSGRPLQLEDEGVTRPGGGGDAEPGQADRQREARQDRRPAGEPIKR